MYLGYGIWGAFNAQSAMALATVGSAVMCNPLAMYGMTNVMLQAMNTATLNMLGIKNK